MTLKMSSVILTRTTRPEDNELTNLFPQKALNDNKIIKSRENWKGVTG